MNYYFVQNTKTKKIFKQYNTFTEALNFIQTHKHTKHHFEVIATEVNDGYNNTIRLHSGETFYKILDEEGDFIELDGGRWIKNCGNGQYHLNGDENIRFAEVSINCYDVNGECTANNLIGYAKI